MTAGVYDITIEQGATFRLSLEWVDSNSDPVDLTGYTARMQLRRRYSATEAALSLTTENGAIVLGGTAGTIVIEAAAGATDGIDFKVGVYDLELEDTNGFVTRLLQGSATISPEVTR